MSRRKLISSYTELEERLPIPPGVRLITVGPGSSFASHAGSDESLLEKIGWPHVTPEGMGLVEGFRVAYGEAQGVPEERMMTREAGGMYPSFAFSGTLAVEEAVKSLIHRLLQGTEVLLLDVDAFARAVTERALRAAKIKYHSLVTEYGERLLPTDERIRRICDRIAQGEIKWILSLGTGTTSGVRNNRLFQAFADADVKGQLNMLIDDIAEPWFRGKGQKRRPFLPRTVEVNALGKDAGVGPGLGGILIPSELIPVAEEIVQYERRDYPDYEPGFGNILSTVYAADRHPGKMFCTPPNLTYRWGLEVLTHKELNPEVSARIGQRRMDSVARFRHALRTSDKLRKKGFYLVGDTPNGDYEHDDDYVSPNIVVMGMERGGAQALQRELLEKHNMLVSGMPIDKDDNGKHPNRIREVQDKVLRFGLLAGLYDDGKGGDIGDELTDILENKI